ncbi:nipped-B-like protein [Iris pallida]|nr:nipped-B-like protein [Iris pallida]
MYRLIRGNRISRNKFMHSIVRKFESGTWNYASVPFLVYCTEILASLPFTCPDEPLYLIYDINRVIQLRAGGLEANMKTWSSLSRQQDQAKIPNEIHEMDDTLAMRQISENNVTTEVPSENSCGFSREDLQKFQADCHDAIALQLLLKLKRHLKIVYVLNDDRCQAFSLKEHPKPGETISRQNVPFNISDISTDLPSSFQDMVQKYQEFKATLKDDTMDYATYTATINRKRPPAPRSSTRGGKPAPLRGRNSSDDDEDEDWTGGARKLDFSSHKTNSVRVTRQRLQA